MSVLGGGYQPNAQQRHLIGRAAYMEESHNPTRALIVICRCCWNFDALREYINVFKISALLK